MSLPYLQLGHEEAVIAKRSLLSAQISILNLIKDSNSYRKSRNLELVNKSKLRAAIKQNISKVSALLNEMPVVDHEEKYIHHEPVHRPAPIPIPIKKVVHHVHHHKKKIEEKPVKKRRTIETELQDIQAKLESLS